MAQHETNAAGTGDDPVAADGAGDPLAGAEIEAQREAAQLAASGDAPTVAESAGDATRPRVSRARAKTVPANAAPGPAGKGRHTTSGRHGASSAVVRSEVTRLGPADGRRDVRLERGGVSIVDADSVSVSQGGIGRLRAGDVSVSMGGVGAARADSLTIERGGVGAALTGRLDLRQGFARTVVARDVTIEQGGSQTVIANRVTMGRGSLAIVVLARRVEGEVRTLLDWRGALAFGAAFGAVVSLLRRRVRR